MKKLNKIILLILTVFVVNVSTASASEFYYVNDNGVTFTEQEYEFFGKMYYDGVQKTLSQELKDKFKDCDMNPNKVEYREYVDYSSDFVPGKITVKGTSHETASKKLRIAKYGDSNPYMTVTLIWKTNPKVRSYDLIGANLAGVSLLDSPITTMTYDGHTSAVGSSKYSNGGFGTSLKLPSSGSNIIVSQTFTVSGSGRVYASYQHAKSSVSQADSKSFSISSSGLGNVFYFSSLNIRNKYDAMDGVYINI